MNTKNLLMIIFMVMIASQIKAQLPQCLIKKISVGYDYSQMRVVLFKKDTCYVIDRRTWDPTKTSRHEIFMISSKRRMPEYVQPEVYNKNCISLFLKNKDLVPTSKIYSWTELQHLIKKTFVAANHIKPRLPLCVIEKISVGDDFSQIKIALYKNDTCYVIQRITWDPGNTTRHEIQMINLKREMPEYIQPEVYNKECKTLNLIMNKDLAYASEKYSWWEVENLIEKKIN